MKNSSVLVLDDLGAEADHGELYEVAWAHDTLYQLFDHRYVHRLPTVITTNVRWMDIPDRIRSRLSDSELGRVVVNAAPDYRSNAANLLKGEGTPAAHQWLKAQETPLFEGHADQIATGLLQAAKKHLTVADSLRREAGYFRHNRARMQYQELREDGFPIGSGMVESGCKRFRARFVGAGMHWSRPGIERLIPIRAAIMSRHFDQLWLRAYKSPQN